MGGAHRRIGDDVPDDHEGNPPMLTASFWTGAVDRAGPTFGLAAGAAVLSLLTSIVSAPAGDKGTTSFLPGAS